MHLNAVNVPLPIAIALWSKTKLSIPVSLTIDLIFKLHELQWPNDEAYTNFNACPLEALYRIKSRYDSLLDRILSKE